jgi:DNA-binding MarR family transcriptional regulator
VSDAAVALEAKGLIKREHWPGDARVMTLRLSSEGELLAAEFSTWAHSVRESLDLTHWRRKR